MYTITYAKTFDENSLDKAEIKKLIQKHETHNLPKMKKNKAYYLGEHAIKKKVREGDAPNTKTVCNHAKDITDTATGYFMGNPITYDNTSEDEADMEPLLVAFDGADTDDADSDNALDMSIYGVAYEYVYAKEDKVELATKVLEPENTFIVYDDTIEQKALFAVYYYLRKDDVSEEGIYVATVFTENLKHVLNIETKNTSIGQPAEGPEEHFMGRIPVIEYRNNKDCIGDFEQQISLIDAYNTLMSDRVNDKEQFIDALLILYGSELGDDEDEAMRAARMLRKEKLLELPTDAKAEYLVSSLDESGAEVLKKALKEDIYTFSHIPNLTDENFVGNSSGVAMEYKLLGLEMITKIKTRHYKKGLKKRIQLFCHYLGLLSLEAEAKSIVPSFSRGLPKNLLEIAQMVTNLKGTVSQKTLLSQIPFVEDPDDEIEAAAAENEAVVKHQKDLFGNQQNTPPKDCEADE